jgi:hypothetical protein
MTLFAVGYFGSMLLLPLYFQVVRGDRGADPVTPGRLIEPSTLTRPHPLR